MLEAFHNGTELRADALATTTPLMPPQTRAVFVVEDEGADMPDVVEVKEEQETQAAAAAAATTEDATDDVQVVAVSKAATSKKAPKVEGDIKAGGKKLPKKTPARRVSRFARTHK